MSHEESLETAILTELERLGLSPETIPGGGLAGDTRGITQLLARMRSLVPPVTWHDVLPDLPAHWVSGRPETWTVPYRPLGPFDYQALPTGPAIHVTWPHDTDRACLAELMINARHAGHLLHGAGVRDEATPAGHALHAYVVLQRGADSDSVDAFLEWLETQPLVELAGVSRRGDEEYVE
jgi:hypothetical protein